MHEVLRSRPFFVAVSIQTNHALLFEKIKHKIKPLYFEKHRSTTTSSGVTGNGSGGSGSGGGGSGGGGLGGGGSGGGCSGGSGLGGGGSGGGGLGGGASRGGSSGGSTSGGGASAAAAQFAADAAALRLWDADMVDDVCRATSENNNCMNWPAVTGKNA